MSSLSSPSPLIHFTRRSLLASTSASIDSRIYSLGDTAPSSSPLLSSSPMLTPLHLARSSECTKWQAADYLDDIHRISHNQRDKSDDAHHSWSCHTRPEHSITPYTHRLLPSLMAKFAAHMPCGDTPLPYNPSPFSSAPETTSSYPQRDGTIADDCEEYDLESMNIHIHETYFATSAERGRWLSSPIAPRARSQAVRGHSSPIKPRAGTSPMGERLRRRTESCAVDRQICASLADDHNEDIRCSSSLPPSSPLSSPLSNLSFLGDDGEVDVIVDPYSNSDDYHYCGRTTPELSISSTTSPVESARPPTPHEALSIGSALPPRDEVSCHPSSRHSHSPNFIDARVRAPGSPSFELDGTLSPLSQFELDLPEAEPLKQPLSDMENQLYREQRTASPGVATDTVPRHNGLPSVQFPSMNPHHKPLDVSLDTVSGATSNKNAKRRENATGNPGVRRTKKRSTFRCESPFSDAKKSRGAENHTSSRSEPPSKKSKCHGDDSESSGVNSRPECSGIVKIERVWRSPSRAAVEHCDSESACALGQLRQSTAVPVDTVDTGFHASLTGMLIEALATSRATSMDSAALYHVLTQAHPHFAMKRSKQELLMDITAVLEAGRVRCGMFERVNSSGERSRHKALESRWFYIPERDEDAERASLISAIMPRQKRNETKKYKQYYYRPLGKTSRWDGVA